MSTAMSGLAGPARAERRRTMGVLGLDPAVLTTGAGGRVTPRRVQLAVALMVLNVADVLLTRGVLARGGVELNPLMRNLMAGVAAPLALKVAVCAVAGVLLLCCPPRSRVAEPAAVVLVGVYVAIVAWNALLLLWVVVNGN